MRNHKYAPVLAVLALSALGCGSAPTSPPDWLPEPDDAGRSEFGGWIEVECRTPRGRTEVHGELLAVSHDRVYVLRHDGMASIPIDSVLKAELTWYDSHGGAVASLAALGTLSTLSNGFFLVFTAPLWMIGGTIATHSQYNAPVVKTQDAAWDEVRMYARFPQGLPPDFVAGTPVVAPEPSPPPAASLQPLPSRRHTEGGTEWGFAGGLGSTQFPGNGGSGLGYVLGMNVGSKWATAGVRFASTTFDEYDTDFPVALDDSRLFDLGLLLGARAGFGPFELAARAGPAVWGFGLDDFLEFDVSFAAQGELFVYPWRNVGFGTIVAYNDNDFLDFYMVTLALAVGPR